MAFFRVHNPLIFNQLHFPKKYCLHLFNHAIPLCNKGLHSPLAKVKAKRLKIGDARAIRAHERDGKEARLDAHQRKGHWKKKKHDVFSLKTVGCVSLSMLNVYPSRV